MFAYVACNPLRHVDPSGTAKKPPALNGLAVYDEKIENRAALGANVQKDHVIAQSKQRLQNPKINRSKQLTVAVETGAAKGSAPAKPHTQVTFHDPQSDVKENKRLKKLTPDDWTKTSYEKEILSPSLESRYRAGYPESPTNIAALDEVGSAFEVDQPNRSPNAARVELDWTVKTEPVGPKVDAKTGLVVPNEAKLAKAGTEAVEQGGKAILKKLGTKALKVVPFVGIGAGLYSAEAEAAQGNYGTAVLEGVGLVPVVGDVVDAARLGVAIGEAGSELLGIDTVAAEHGDRFESAAKFVGLGEDASRIVGATGAALSSITVAPYIALKRKVMGWFN